MKNTIVEKINKDNKKMLKNANTIIFLLSEDGQSVIEGIKQTNIDGFGTDITSKVYVGTRMICYEKFNGDDGYNNYEIIKGFDSIHYSNNDLVWQTIVKNLKKDDEIILEWIVGNNSNILNENNLSHDMLYLIVKRNDKHEMKFLVTEKITEKNSLARMVDIRRK